MKTQITFNRSTKTITVIGLYDMDADKYADQARFCGDADRRNHALESLTALYARAVDAAAADPAMDIDTAEARLAYVVEAIATMTVTDWHQLPKLYGEEDTSDTRLMHLYADGKLVNHAAEERVANAPRPEKPAVIANGRWNGKLYGSARKGYSIYVDNNKIDLTEDQSIELRAYLDVAATAEQQAKAKAPATPYTVVTEPDPAPTAETTANTTTETANDQTESDANTTTFESNPDFDKMIAKFHLSIFDGGKVGTKYCPNKDLPTLKAFLTAHKAELLTYIPAKAAWEQAEESRKAATFESIPGLKELRTARRAVMGDRRRFTEAWESGSGIYPKPTTSGQDLELLEEQYPGAVFALKVEDERLSHNIEISQIARRAYDRLRGGEDVQSVQADYNADKSAFAEEHLWD